MNSSQLAVLLGSTNRSWSWMVKVNPVSSRSSSSNFLAWNKPSSFLICEGATMMSCGGVIHLIDSWLDSVDQAMSRLDN
ncbi:hypothetical protein WICPIJ_002178 [Wickerhamomyces pijperi]|uniref:Uncharacterized protein n=1 Tax=Wickerhamomyces pijperi TaxID=599730 RepID=A0A9P8TPX1_WICPI|nr:hypothetical protein WICPIJ_002178 [Wickerhamomyces pijperi]